MASEREILVIPSDGGDGFMAYRKGDDPEAYHWPKRMNPPPFGIGDTRNTAVTSLIDNEYFRSVE